jgi:hypothetical protein
MPRFRLRDSARNDSFWFRSHERPTGNGREFEAAATAESGKGRKAGPGGNGDGASEEEA